MRPRRHLVAAPLGVALAVPPVTIERRRTPSPAPPSRPPFTGAIDGARTVVPNFNAECWPARMRVRVAGHL